MNDILAGIMEEDAPKFNQDVVLNMGTRMLKDMVPFLDNLIRENMESATPKLKYHGIRVLKPDEAYKTLVGNGSTRPTYDTSRSDLFKVELMFTYNGERIPDRYLFLPYASTGGIIHFSNTKYHLVPVLTDTVITPNEDGIFVRLLKNKLKFERINRNIYLNDTKYSANIIHGNINFKPSTSKSQAKTPVVVAPIGLYIISEMGVKEAFKRYSNVDVKITTGEISETDKETYDVYRSTKNKPVKLNIRGTYTGHDLKILVPKENDDVYTTEMAAAIIYALDIFPNHAEEINTVVNGNDVETEKRYFKILLGKLVFGNEFSVQRLYNDIDERIGHIRSYIDSSIQNRLSEVDIHVEDFFDLLAYLMRTFSIWLLNSKIHNNNVFNRYFDVKYYIGYPIIIGLNKTVFDITKRSTSKNMTMKEITQLFNKPLSARKIFKVVSSSGTNISLQLVDYCGDTWYPKITSVTALQEQAAKGVDKGKQTVFPQNTQKITGADAFAGSFFYLPKKSPTPKVRCNPFMKVNLRTGRLAPDEHDKKVIEALDIKLTSKQVHTDSMSEDLMQTLISDDEMVSDLL